MLSFVVNSLVISTQRYLSFYHGLQDTEKLSKIFGNSLLIHLFFCVIVLVGLLSITSLVILYVLDIPPERIDAAKVVYILVVCVLALSIITSPFRSLFIARENIVYISIIDIIDAILKVFAAIILSVCSWDKLVTYALLLVAISIFNIIAFAVYAAQKYDECRCPHKSDFDKQTLKQLLGFASWTLYSNGCVVVRNQGVAIIINRYFSVALNASYGVAQQVSGAVASVAQAIANALSPQIIKSEGKGDRKRMFYLAGLECKYSSIMLSIVAIPMVLEMPAILQLWLKDVPTDAIMFCRMAIIAAMCDVLTTGLGIANQAIGDIKLYSIIWGSLKLFVIPASVLLLHYFYEPYTVMICFALMEFISSLLRIWFLHITANLDIKDYFVRIMLPTIMIIFVNTALCCFIQYVINLSYNFVIMIIVGGMVSIFMAYLIMSEEEKNSFRKLILKK